MVMTGIKGFELEYSEGRFCFRECSNVEPPFRYRFVFHADSKSSLKVCYDKVYKELLLKDNAFRLKNVENVRPEFIIDTNYPREIINIVNLISSRVYNN